MSSLLPFPCFAQQQFQSSIHAKRPIIFQMSSVGSSSSKPVPPTLHIVFAPPTTTTVAADNTNNSNNSSSATSSPSASSSSATLTPLDDAEMRELPPPHTNNSCSTSSSPEPMRSPTRVKNTLGLTLPGSKMPHVPPINSSSGGTQLCAHSVDSMLSMEGDSHNNNNNRKGNWRGDTRMDYCSFSSGTTTCSPPPRAAAAAQQPSVPPVRIIHGIGDEEQNNSNIGFAEMAAHQRNIVNKALLKTPPLICEQGPSAPSSPTTSSPNERSAKRSCPLLSVDAIQRINLLSPNYVPACTVMDASKLPPPVSPSYPTSDLGSSPRSSISTNHYSSLGINPSNWLAFCDAYAARCRQGGGGASFAGQGGDADDASECGGMPMGSSDKFLGVGSTGNTAGLLSPHQLFSPAPYSPFSDYGVADLHVTSATATPYSSRSPNLSPSPVRRASGVCGSSTGSGNFHFNFEHQIRSRSSLSTHARPNENNNAASTASTYMAGGIPNARLLDSEVRERSRSEGEALAVGKQLLLRGAEEEQMDVSPGHGHSTLSVPTGGGCAAGGGGGGHHLHAGQKRRLLQKSRRAEEEEEEQQQQQQQQEGMQTNKIAGTQQQPNIQTQQQNSSNPSSTTTTAATQLLLSRQPTIEEPPPSPTLAELFQPNDLDNDRRKQVEEWIRQQTAALEAFRQSLIPPQQEVNLLQVPNILPQNSLEQLWPLPTAPSQQHQPFGGPIRSPSLWRRSRSESDVSAATSTATNNSNKSNNNNASTEKGGEGVAVGRKSAIGRRASHQQQQPPQLMVPLNEATFVCEHCGQGFSMHDRLTKHIASRHRDRSASMNDEGSRVHKCQLCSKSFGRSDMLTRHMRLHTGLKPYACQLCGQVFSRSDHLSTHQRTHTGEKPYRCPQCNYAASRRDMITRHMRTHMLGPDGLPLPFGVGELQFPPINELSLNPPPPPILVAQQPQQQAEQQQQHLRPSTLLSTTISSLSTTASSTATTNAPNIATPTSTAAAAAIASHHHHHQLEPIQNAPPIAQPIPSAAEKTIVTTTAAAPSAATTSSSTAAAATSINEQIAKLLAAAVNGAANGLLVPSLMFNTLGANQMPAALRKSSPNLLSAGDYPSAFRPPGINAIVQQTCSTATALVDPAIAAAAAAQVQQLISQQQQQQQQRLSLPGTAEAAAAFPFLFRQNSFGGLDFSDQHQPMVPSTTTATTPRSDQAK